MANTGPGANRGSGGGARGCGFEERWVYMRVQRGVISYTHFVRICVSMCVVKRQFTFDPLDKKWLRERLRVCRGEARNQLRGLKEGGSARRGAMLCLSADLTTHAGSVKT